MFSLDINEKKTIMNSSPLSFAEVIQKEKRKTAMSIAFWQKRIIEEQNLPPDIKSTPYETCGVVYPTISHCQLKLGQDFMAALENLDESHPRLKRLVREFSMSFYWG